MAQDGSASAGRPLSVLAPARYPWRFNSPRHSRHTIHIRKFLPVNYVDARFEGITMLNPWPPQRVELVHAFNRIPLGVRPYIIGFESHLPRGFGMEDTAYFRQLQRSLAGPRCRGIIAISRHAQAIFTAGNAGSPFAEPLAAKLIQRYPNLVLPARPVGGNDDNDVRNRADDRFHLSFVGGHFARKGGCVAVRLAELAEQRGVPLRVTVVSKLQMGNGIWTDPLRPAYFDQWRQRLNHRSITVEGAASNAAVRALFRQSDATLLTTFSDTFGYSAVEAMAESCPVIATRQGALPEFIEDGVNGVLLDLPTNAFGEWIGSAAAGRDTAPFERLFTDEIERLAEAALARIEPLANSPETLGKMRLAARATTERLFDSHQANAFWDDYYETAVA